MRLRGPTSTPSVEYSTVNKLFVNVSVVCSASLKFNFTAVPTTVALVNVGAVLSAVPLITTESSNAASAFSASDASVTVEPA